MEINKEDLLLLNNLKNKLDIYWSAIPDDLKYADRFDSRELRFSMYKSDFLENYLVWENTFIAMTKHTFNLENVTLKEAYDLIEEHTQKRIK